LCPGLKKEAQPSTVSDSLPLLLSSYPHTHFAHSFGQNNINEIKTGIGTATLINWNRERKMKASKSN